MEFRKYQHIERLETDETDGILIGMCYVFPKIDGTNSQLWWDNGLQSGSRNRHLSPDNDNQGFCKWALQQKNFIDFFIEYPEYKLFGEWLVPHTLRTYENSAWNKFYVFDVIVKDSGYLPYHTYQPILDKFGIDYIPPICRIENPTVERLIIQLEKNTFLIKDGYGPGEGIVIKNYEYKNKYGRQVWAKIVRNEYKAKHNKAQITDVVDKKQIELLIVEKYVTPDFIDKEFNKIKNDSGWSSKMIPRLFSTVYHCLITEECWNFVKEYKNPVIDFGRLYQFLIVKVKQVKPELF
jgi:hypothetical protein